MLADRAHLEAVPVRIPHVSACVSSDKAKMGGNSRAGEIAVNETAELVFALCDGQRNVGEIVALISEAYPQSASGIEADVTVALALQRYSGMIDVSPRLSHIFYDVSQSGLGDRMRGLVSCLALADILGIRLSMRWVPDDACDARFHDLFEVPQGLEYLGEASLAPDPDPSMLIVTERLTPSGFHAKYRIYLADTDCGSFRFKAAQHSRSLVPVRELAGKIAAFRSSSGLDKSTVGLHIRRTDHPNADAMPDDLIEAVLEYEKSRAGDTRFFLATDNRHTQARFLRHSSVVSYPVQWNDEFLPEWGGVAGRLRRRHCSATDALIDLYLLAECGRIYSVGSSFSHYAAMLGGINVTSGRAIFERTGTGTNG